MIAIILDIIFDIFFTFIFFFTGETILMILTIGRHQVQSRNRYNTKKSFWRSVLIGMTFWLLVGAILLYIYLSQ
jgi:hypothetical protein